MLVVTIIITLFILGLSFFSVYILDNTAAVLIDLLGGVEAAILNEDWNNAEQRLAVLEKRWEKTHFLWSMLIEHNEIDNIDISIAHIKSYVKFKASNDAFAEVSALYKIFEHIPAMEKFRIQNIF
ncbi:MAG: DUF4363 family protein [Bacillota bacterium]